MTDGAEWTVTESPCDISVTRPSPYCTVHRQGLRAEIALGVPLTAGQRHAVTEGLKEQVRAASDALSHCETCGPHPFGDSGGCSGPCLDAR